MKRSRGGGGLRLLALLALAAGLAWDVRSQLLEPLPIREAVTIDIPTGAPFGATLDQLQARGVLGARAALYLRGYARATGEGGAIKAGEYDLMPGLSARALLALLVSGKVKLHELRLAEGSTFAQAWQAVAADASLKHTLAAPDPEALMSAIGEPGVHPEGRFLPETYHFPKQTTDVAFMRRAAAAMQAALDQEWAQRDPAVTLASPAEALILASIVEKETGVPAERAEIAGVFLRRLQRGMRLQTDPTVIYGLGSAFDGNLRRADLERDSPYNSYTRDGLPPTPICLPGRAALHAALHPAAGDALYFVARGDGSHQFSATLEEHDAAVRRFQLGKP